MVRNIKTKGPLTGLLVLDLSRVRSGPSAVRQLADWGANVIKIETPTSIDNGEDLGGPRHGSDFQNLHRNKRSLTLNLKSSEGKKILYRLAKSADVLVENFRPKVKERLKIDFNYLKKLNKRLIYASISGFGQDGPYSDLPGFDQVAQGMGGLMSVTGLKSHGPVRAGIPIADLSAGLYCALGILLALNERNLSGLGQKVNVSLLEAQIAMLDFQAARYLMSSEIPKQQGNHHPTMTPMGTYQTADGFINIASAGNAMWKRLCKAMKLDSMIEDEKFNTDELRIKNKDELNKILEEKLLLKNSSYWIQQLNEASVPCGYIYNIDEVFADPQVKHLGIAKYIFHKNLGNIGLVGQPMHLDRTPSQIIGSAPEKGEHTDEILMEFGYDKNCIDKFKKNKIV